MDGSNGSVGSALAVVEPTNSMEANVGVLMRRATDVAGVCREIVTRTAQSIQGRKYVRVEGWQAMAVAYGCVLSARDVEKVEGGIKAVGEVRRMSDGYVISMGEGFVGDDESTWKGRPEYARRAMAQTRAMSRAGRSAFSFLVTLIDSNMSTTPAEEMDGVNVGSTEPPPPNVTKPVSRGTAPLREALRPSPPRANEPPPHSDADFRPLAHDAATGEVRPAHVPTTPPTHDRTLPVPFGKNKGKPIADVDEVDLKYLESAFSRDLADPSKARYHDKTRAQLTAVRGELAYRGL
jgi:hypothetical protein